jgi:hypothetical protein
VERAARVRIAATLERKRGGCCLSSAVLGRPAVAHRGDNAVALVDAAKLSRTVRLASGAAVRCSAIVDTRCGYFESCRGRAEATADTFNHLPPRLAQPDVTEFFIEISLP